MESKIAALSSLLYPLSVGRHVYFAKVPCIFILGKEAEGDSETTKAHVLYIDMPHFAPINLLSNIIFLKSRGCAGRGLYKPRDHLGWYVFHVGTARRRGHQGTADDGHHGDTQGSAGQRIPGVHRWLCPVR